jgi:hypothetical protein
VVDIRAHLYAEFFYDFRIPKLGFFFFRQESAHIVADYLEEQILSEKIQADGKSKALKVLVSLGLLRGSLPNYHKLFCLGKRDQTAQKAQKGEA